MSDGWYKCDRCGEFERGPIRKGGRSLGFGTDFAEADKRRIKFGHLHGEDESGSTVKTVDLCHECRKALTEWLEDDQ